MRARRAWHAGCFMRLFVAGGLTRDLCLTMPYGYYISAEGALVQSKRMEVIANNLANVNTPGYKKDFATFQARFAEAIEQGIVPERMGLREDIGGGVMVLETRTDFSPGTMKNTGIPTDLAIEGDAFFE